MWFSICVFIIITVKLRRRTRQQQQQQHRKEESFIPLEVILMCRKTVIQKEWEWNAKKNEIHSLCARSLHCVSFHRVKWLRRWKTHTHTLSGKAKCECQPIVCTIWIICEIYPSYSHISSAHFTMWIIIIRMKVGRCQFAAVVVIFNGHEQSKYSIWMRTLQFSCSLHIFIIVYFSHVIVWPKSVNENYDKQMLNSAAMSLSYTVYVSIYHICCGWFCFLAYPQKWHRKSFHPIQTISFFVSFIELRDSFSFSDLPGANCNWNTRSNENVSSLHVLVWNFDIKRILSV